MLFNSLDFAVFLPVVFLLYWYVFKISLRGQNIFVVIASFVFYGWWDYRFLALILFSIIVDFSIGCLFARSEKKSARKFLLYTSVFVNLGLLAVFKYFNFFAENFAEAFSFFGSTISVNSLNIVLPVGISFYTFQTLSYTIDIYRDRILPSRDFWEFAAYVSFFPQLVAGPIERATHLLPQFQRRRNFDYSKAVDGARQILWGLIKKVVVADSCAQFANAIFNDSPNQSGSVLFIGALFFTFQIYGDFSGYSDIAIGTARLFGFDLKRNFAFPYFSRNVGEFWRRWHISLSTWFRDYLYIPLGGSKGGKGSQIRNTFIIFLVSGFWHGANWTFIFWGGLNALLFIPLLLRGRNRRYLEVVAVNKVWPSLRETFQMIATFLITVVAWIFFRSESLDQAFGILGKIFSRSLFTIPYFQERHIAVFVMMLVGLFTLVEWAGRRDQYAIEKIWLNYKAWLRRSIYLLLAILVLLFSGQQQSFIYFQF